MSEMYTEKQWEDEMDEVLTNGSPSPLGSIIPCPDCKTIGFYGPRKSVVDEKITRKYRACKFCGFWQEVWGNVFDEKGGEAYRCKMVYCEDCNKKYGEYYGYNWNVPWAKDLGSCVKCGNIKIKEVDWPSDDINHPFNNIKEEIKKLINGKNI